MGDRFMGSREIWQAYDCPVTGNDSDLHGTELVYSGKSFPCHWCGGNHTAGFGVDVETAIDQDGGRRFIDLPKDAEELQRLITADAQA